MPSRLDPLPPGWAGSRYASFGRRLGAQLIDFLCLLPVGFLLGLVQAMSISLQGGDPAGQDPGLLSELMVQLILALIILLFWVLRQATPGKLALGLRIVDAETGAPASFPRLLARYCSYILSALPLCLGYFWMLWDPRRQCWHDKLGRTVVLHVGGPSTGVAG